MPALPRRRGPRAQVRGGGAHLRNGQGGLVLGALGDLARRGAEVQAVEGHPERVLVEAQGVQEHGLPQVPHGRLQPVRTLLNVRHLHVHLATEQDHEAAGTDSIARARRGCRGTPLVPGFPAPPSALRYPKDPRRTKRWSLQTTGDLGAHRRTRAKERQLGPAGLHATENNCGTKARWRAQQTRGARRCVSSSTPGGSWRGQAGEFSTTEAQALPQRMGRLGSALSSLHLIGRSTHSPAQNASRGPVALPGVCSCCCLCWSLLGWAGLETAVSKLVTQSPQSLSSTARRAPCHSLHPGREHQKSQQIWSN